LSIFILYYFQLFVSLRIILAGSAIVGLLFVHACLFIRMSLH